MSEHKIAQIIEGIPCSLTANQVMELGAKCSGQSYSLEKLIQIGKTLFKTDSQSCFKFYEYVEKHQITRNIYKDFTHQPFKIQIYYSLAALALSKALRQSDKQSIQRWQKEFNRYMNEGSKVKTSAQKLNQLLRGFNSYYSGDFTQSINNFNWFEQYDKKEGNMSTVALIGLAQINFTLKKYEKALQYYKKALISNKNLPSKARIGMAYCFYQLEKYQLAEKCFLRILFLDPNCFYAYMGLAVIKYRSNNIEKYFEYLKKAYQLKPNDPLVLIHLSQHFLLRGEFQKCLKLSMKGLQFIQLMPKFFKKQNSQSKHRDDYEMYKARFNNLIGQVHHAKLQYDQAKKYYQFARQKGLKNNQVALAQVYIHSNMSKQALIIFQGLFNGVKITELKIIAEYYKTYAYLKGKPPIKPISQQLGPNNYYKQALKYNKYDYEALIDYSTYLLDANQKKQTLKVFQSALKALQLTGKQRKPQLINNIAVCLYEQKQLGQSMKTILQAQRLLKSSNKTTPQQQLKYHSLYLTIQFNKAVILETQHQYSEAMKIHQNLIAYNKFYIDSYVRLGDILNQIGKRSAALQLLENAVNQCSRIKYQELRIDKLISMKSYLQLIEGRVSQARQTAKKLGKNKYPYDQLYQICIGYQMVIKKQLDKAFIKEFLHSSREIAIVICQGDPYNIFAFMVLVILFLSDNKITKEQGIQYFNQLKIGQFQFPQIQYNFGVFSILNQDYENALLCLNRFKQTTKTNKADQYISLIYFLKGDFTRCLNSIKKNIINQPNNLKYRYQYAYVNQKRVQKLYEQQKNFKDLKNSNKFLGVCKRIYESLSKIITTDYIKSIQNSQLKQKMKSEITKLRGSCEDRQRFVDNQINYYKLKQNSILQKERKMKQQQNNTLQELRKAKQSRKLMEQLNKDENESDSSKQRLERRKKLMQRSLAQTQRANQLYKINRQKQKQQQDQKEENKRQKRNNENKKPKKQKNKAQKQQKNQEEQDYVSEQQFLDEQPSGDASNEGESQQRQRHKKKKKKKNKNKERSGSDQNESKKKKKKRKKQRKQRSVDEQQQKSEGQQVLSEPGEDPFKQDQEEGQQKQEIEVHQREQPQKKNRKKDNDQDDNINIDQFLINQ